MWRYSEEKIKIMRSEGLLMANSSIKDHHEGIRHVSK